MPSAKFIASVLLSALFFACNSGEKVAVFMIGDSTMADKPNPESNPERGWGQMLPDFFDECSFHRSTA